MNENHLHANTWSNHTAGSAWAGRAESAYHLPPIRPWSAFRPRPASRLASGLVSWTLERPLGPFLVPLAGGVVGGGLPDRSRV